MKLLTFLLLHVFWWRCFANKYGEELYLHCSNFYLDLVTFLVGLTLRVILMPKKTLVMTKQSECRTILEGPNPNKTCAFPYYLWNRFHYACTFGLGMGKK